MIKRQKKVNALIKRRGLVLKLKEAGIKRAGKEAISVLENYLVGELNGIIGVLKEEMIVKGRKTLMKEDIQKLKIKNEETWEI